RPRGAARCSEALCAPQHVVAGVTLGDAVAPFRQRIDAFARRIWPLRGYGHVEYFARGTHESVPRVDHASVELRRGACEGAHVLRTRVEQQQQTERGRLLPCMLPRSAESLRERERL